MPAYHIHLKKPKNLPFRSFYLCTDSEAAADVAASVDVLIELPAKPYIPKIKECDSCDDESAKILDSAEDGVILVPMLTDRSGAPKYVSLYKPDVERRRKEYFWSMRGVSWGFRREEVTSSVKIYESRVGLIVKGQRQGSPCSHCPKVLDSLGADATCTFGLKVCKETLNLKELLRED